MEDPILWPILLQIVLIALNAIFACAEIAIISINDNKLAQLVSQGDKRAVRLARLTSRPAQFLATKSPLPCPASWAAPSPPITSPIRWWPCWWMPGSPFPPKP